MGAEGLVLADVGSAKSNGFDSYMFRSCVPKQFTFVGELEISLWSLVDLDMTLT